jgi:hypothetical protein
LFICYNKQTNKHKHTTHKQSNFYFGVNVKLSNVNGPVDDGLFLNFLSHALVNDILQFLRLLPEYVPHRGVVSAVLHFWLGVGLVKPSIILNLRRTIIITKITNSASKNLCKFFLLFLKN